MVLFVVFYDSNTLITPPPSPPLPSPSPSPHPHANNTSPPPPLPPITRSYLPWYCSLFPDVDGPFGSLGSFFDTWTPSSGSFEANPPFIPSLMVQMTLRMEMLLKQVSEGVSE